MWESIITIAITGLFAGFIFAMPIAGPISILITSNALKGRLRYCNLVSLGASVADFTFVFIAVFGLTRLYSLYAPAQDVKNILLKDVSYQSERFLSINKWFIETDKVWEFLSKN